MQFSQEIQAFYKRKLLSSANVVPVHFTPEDLRFHEELGTLRQAQHTSNHKHAERLRPHDPAWEHRLGVRGEHVWEKLAPHLFSVDRRLLPGGDRGTDTGTKGSVDIDHQTRTIWGYGLIKRVGHVRASIYTLTISPEDEQTVSYIIGWCTKADVIAAPTQILSPVLQALDHVIDPDSATFRPVSSLIRMLGVL